MRHRLAMQFFLGAAAVLWLGCVGTINQNTDRAGGPGQNGGSGGPGGGAGGSDPGAGGSAPPLPPGVIPDVVCEPDHAIGTAPLRRLSHTEYNNTIQDLFGVALRPADTFPGASGVTFDTDVDGLSVSLLQAESYQTSAEQLSAEAVKDLAALLPCDPVAIGGSACGRQFVETFGRRAYRRPLTAVEVDRLMTAFDDGLADFDFSTGIELAIQAMLQSPNFLYRPEFGTGDESVTAVAPYEMASRLGYLLWGTMPDEALFAAAASGALTTADGVAVQAARLLASPRARARTVDFHAQWMHLGELIGLEKDATLFPMWNDVLRGSMRAETEAFADHVMWDGAGTLTEMLTASYSFPDRTTAPLYGLQGGATPARADLPATQRAGFLTQPALMAILSKANQTNPIHRGKFVRQQLLCQPPPPPPPDVEAEAPPPDPNLSTRERFEQHRADPVCASCHAQLDPIGFGFENLDPIGRYRDSENDKPIDASGEIVDTVDIDGTFNGAVELAGALASSRQVSECVVRNWFRYSAGRIETTDDVCTLIDIHDRFAGAATSLREILLALVDSRYFRELRKD